MRAWLWILIAIAAVGGGVLYMNRGSFKPASQRAISQAGVDAIKQHEGWSAKVYKDSAGYPTIGYGHLIKAGEVFTTITPAQGETMLRADLATAEAGVRKYVTVPITQGMYDALVSWVFNLGAGSLQKSTLLAKLNAGDYLAAAAEFVKWNKAGGVEVAGLTARRTDEQSMFSQGIA
jgi:lysozyme